MQADELLRQDARERGFINGKGRGYAAYARSIGITTKKILETIYKHEKVGFTEEQMAALRAAAMGNIVQVEDDREEDSI